VEFIEGVWYIGDKINFDLAGSERKLSWESLEIERRV